MADRGSVCDCDIDLLAFGHELECKTHGPIRRPTGQPPPAPTHQWIAGRWVRIDPAVITQAAREAS